MLASPASTMPTVLFAPVYNTQGAGVLVINEYTGQLCTLSAQLNHNSNQRL